MKIQKWCSAVTLVCIAFAWACKRENPDFCCASEAECSRLDVDGVRPCKEPGQTCKDNECVGFECISSMDCGDGSLPICIDHLCVAACTQNADCEGIPERPYCGSDGACVGCITSLQCMGDAPICDLDSRSCRGCSDDSECSSGVCIEAQGTCADAASLIYVSQSGQDTGLCDSPAVACRSIQYAQGLVNQQRRVIRVLGSLYSLGASTVALNEILDAAGTTIGGTMLPYLTVSGSATINGVRFASTTFGNDVLVVNPGGVLEMASSTLENAGIFVSKGTATFTKMVVTNATIGCDGGMASIRSSNFQRSSFKPSSCRFEVRASKFDQEGDSGRFIFGDGRFTIENNIFIENFPNTPVQIFGFETGSTFRFNTIVNTASPNTGAGILCPEGLDVTSNIFALSSPNPIVPCVARHSLFDAEGQAAAAAGTDNVAGERALFFKNAAIGDYHLNVGSPAIDKGEPNLITTDIEGHARSALPDIGAYEAP